MVSLTEYINEGLFGNSFSKCKLIVLFEFDSNEKLSGVKQNEIKENAMNDYRKFYSFFNDNASKFCDIDSINLSYNYGFRILCELSKLKKLKQVFDDASKKLDDKAFVSNCIKGISIILNKKSKEKSEIIKNAVASYLDDEHLDVKNIESSDSAVSVQFIGKNKVNGGLSGMSFIIYKLIKLYDKGFKS